MAHKVCMQQPESVILIQSGKKKEEMYQLLYYSTFC